MKVNEIERLLARYYDGETSETEEKELKRFFTEEDVPAHLLAEKEIFMQLAAQPAPEIPEGLESRLSRKIDQWDTGERRTLKIKKHTRTLRLQWIGSIAASLLILLSVGLYLYKPYPAPHDTCATPEEAYVQAQKSLLIGNKEEIKMNLQGKKVLVFGSGKSGIGAGSHRKNSRERKRTIKPIK